MTAEAVEEAAKTIGCAVSAVRAVMDVESQGGFLSDGRPKILFERAYFSRLTGAEYDQSSPDISAKTWGGYRGGTAEYDRLEKAINLDRNAALRSASWGAFQIMGNNFGECGFSSVDDFVDAMVEGEPQQLEAFVSFVGNAGLDDELRRLDWAGFARGYNGPQYKANKYDLKLAAAYSFHMAGGSRADGPLPVLKMGDAGDNVKKLQAALQVTADGDFGPGTKAAVVSFQQVHNLYADGIVGPATWQALGID
jgi:hypothetical protein